MDKQDEIHTLHTLMRHAVDFELTRLREVCTSYQESDRVFGICGIKYEIDGTKLFRLRMVKRNDKAICIRWRWILRKVRLKWMIVVDVVQMASQMFQYVSGLYCRSAVQRKWNLTTEFVCCVCVCVCVFFL